MKGHARLFSLLLLIAIPSLAFQFYPNPPNPVPRRRASSRMADIPRVMLWAWERPEDLRFVNSKRVGVAFLVNTIAISNKGLAVHPRRQPLQIPTDAALVAVTRMETSSGWNSGRLKLYQPQILKLIVSSAQIARVRAVQIDFDATLSQREFYKDLLIALREALPDTVELSVAALSSWCMGDDWLSRLPVDEVVPMLYRMGPDRREILGWLESGHDFKSPNCRDAVGVSLDEPFQKLPANRRAYIFNPNPWTPDAAEAAFQKIRASQ